MTHAYVLGWRPAAESGYRRPVGAAGWTRLVAAAGRPRLVQVVGPSQPVLAAVRSQLDLHVSVSVLIVLWFY